MQNPAATSRLRRRIALLVIVALVLYWPLAFFATHMPMDNLPSSGLPLDKVFHFCSFGLLAFLLTGELALRFGWHWKWALCAVLVCAAYGIVDELTQIPVGRTADPLDWLADVVGATTGASIAGGLCLWVRRKSQATVPRTLFSERKAAKRRRQQRRRN